LHIQNNSYPHFQPFPFAFKGILAILQCPEIGSGCSFAPQTTEFLAGEPRKNLRERKEKEKQWERGNLFQGLTVTSHELSSRF